MAYELKEGQGTLFKNEKQNDRQPDLKGTILIDGITYEIAAWVKTSKRGEKFYSLQASLPREVDRKLPSPSYPDTKNTQNMPAIEEDFSSQDENQESLPF